MRLFVAVELSEAVKSELIATQRELKQWLPPGGTNLTRPESLHLTLRFLGDVPEARIEELKAALAGAVVRHCALELTCEGLSCFPNLRFPRILWAGVQEARDATTIGSSGSPEPERLAGARRNMGRRGNAALPEIGRADLPVRRDFPPASAAMQAAGRPDEPEQQNQSLDAPSKSTDLPTAQGGALNSLQRAVSTACDPFAVKPDVQPFAGHVTLGRFHRLGREDSKQVAREIERFADRRFGQWTAGEVILFRSELRPDGARHSPIERFPLRRDCLNR